MKKKKKLMVALGIFIMALFIPLSVYAAPKYAPLKKMPRTSVSMSGVVTEKGYDFTTPSYDIPIKMTATSSNPKVAAVKVSNIYDPYMKKYYSGYEVIRKGYGKTTINVKVVLAGKQYKNSCKYTFNKYANPFSSLKIGNANYTKNMKSPALELTKSKLRGKLSFKLKKGYKITNATCLYGSYDTAPGMQYKKIKNNAKLPSNTKSITLYLQNTKTKATFAVQIMEKGFFYELE